MIWIHLKSSSKIFMTEELSLENLNQVPLPLCRNFSALFGEPSTASEKRKSLWGRNPFNSYWTLSRQKCFLPPSSNKSCTWDSKISSNAIMTVPKQIGKLPSTWQYNFSVGARTPNHSSPISLKHSRIEQTALIWKVLTSCHKKWDHNQDKCHRF